MKKIIAMLLCTLSISSIHCAPQIEVDANAAFDQACRQCNNRTCSNRVRNAGRMVIPATAQPTSLPNGLTRVPFNNQTAFTTGCVNATSSGGLSLPPGIYRINYELNLANTANSDSLTFWLGSKPACDSIITPVNLSSRQVFIPDPPTYVPVLGRGEIIIKICNTTTFFLFYQTNGAANLTTLPPTITPVPTFTLEAVRIQ